MNSEILAQNVRRLRTGKKLSQKLLADRAGLSLSAIKGIELVKSEPRMRTIQAIAKELDVKLSDLFYPVLKLQTVRFRSAKRMQNRENILAEVARWLEDFIFLENCLKEQISFRLKSVRNRCSRDNLPGAAGLCRKELGLKSTEPIYNISGLLEYSGVKLLTSSVCSDSFFGLSVGEEDGGPAMLVNVWERISVERQIFSAAHELGHLMLHHYTYDVNNVDVSKEEEKEADCFAGHFLLPNDGFKKEWERAAGLHFVERVFKVKRIFKVSYKAVLSRLIEYGKADNSIWKKFHIAYQKRYNRRLSYKEEPMCIDPAEPFGMQKFDFYEDRFKSLIKDALKKDKISLSRGAEMLRIGIEEMQELLQNGEDIL